MNNDITGMRFGRLTVLGRSKGEFREGTSVWDVKCDCGNVFRCYRSNLVNGNTRSCGCLKKEKCRNAWNRHWQNAKNQ